MIRLGTETWETAKFRGTLYDYNTPLDEFLPMYAAQFDAVEFVPSFSDLPSARRMDELRRKVKTVNAGFRFCPVIPRRISHEFKWGENRYDMEEFADSMNKLGVHRGPAILRLPETFAPESWKELFIFFKLWPEDWPLAVQFTHMEWFRKTMLWKSLIKEIQGSRFSIMIEDKLEYELRPEELLTGKYLLVRFFGRVGLGKDEERLGRWTSMLKDFNVGDTYFFLHEEEEMCLAILKKMALTLGGSVRVPQSFEMNSPQLTFRF